MPARAMHGTERPSELATGSNGRSDWPPSKVDQAKENGHRSLDRRAIERRRYDQHGRRSASPKERKFQSVLTSDPLRKQAMERKTAMAPSQKNRSRGVLELVHMGLNFILWLLGLAVVIVGALLLANGPLRGLQSLRHFGPLQSAAVLVIVIGILVLVLGFIGCLGVNGHSRPLLLIFTFFLACLVILEIAACALTWYYQKGTTVDNQLATLIDRVIREVHDGRAEYREGDYDWRFNRNELSFIEYTLRCCGSRRGISDYTSIGVSVPLSCYNRDYSPYGNYRNDYYNTGNPYNDVGCVDALQNFLFTYGLILGLLSFGALLIEIALILISLTLVFRFASDGASAKQAKSSPLAQGSPERTQRYSPVPQQRSPMFDEGHRLADIPDTYPGQTKHDRRSPYHPTMLSEDV